MKTVRSVRMEKLKAQQAYLRKIRAYKIRARESHQDVTNMKINLKNQKLARQEEQRLQSERNYVKRMKKELRTRSQKQKDIKVLEQQEANLIQRLQNAQLMQEDALAGLQHLLASRHNA